MESGEGNIMEIDGGVLEGGGQILRNASSYSCIFGVPIQVNNIRAGRDKPGLRPQHLSGVELLRDLSNGTLDNAVIGSTMICLHPRGVEGGSYNVDTKTAGSVCLLIQSALPCVLFAKKSCRLVLKGGTNVGMAPPIDYLMNVFQPMVKGMGIKFACQVVRRGFYPKGGGEVSFSCDPVTNIQPITLLDRGKVTQIFGLACVAGVLPIKMAHIMRSTAEGMLKAKFKGYHISITVKKDEEAVGNGSWIQLVAETDKGIRLGTSGLGERGTRAEDVASKCAQEMIEILESNSCVDNNSQDQLIIFMALANGRSSIRCLPPTLHTQTAIHVAQLLTKARFDIEEISNKEVVINCEGSSHTNQHL